MRKIDLGVRFGSHDIGARAAGDDAVLTVMPRARLVKARILS